MKKKNIIIQEKNSCLILHYVEFLIPHSTVDLGYFILLIFIWDIYPY
jgi:hypothetical protein